MRPFLSLRLLRRRATLLGLGIAFLSPLTRRANAAEPPLLAVFDFLFVDTSPAPPSKEEIARARMLSNELRARLAASGLYRLVDPTVLRAKMADQADILHCNGCERDAAQAVGATLACYGWVQKVSNLILNINLVIEDAKTGKIVRSGSVDIRGNSDEMWRRGLRFLLEDRILDGSPTGSQH